MSFAPTDAPEDVSSGVFAPADSGLAETPSVATFLPPSPEDMARDNARGGRRAMNEYYDGCVLLGADDRPVMRNDGSRVGFFFRDAQRLADELAAGPGPDALPSGNNADDRAAAWRAQRRALAPLDSGFNKDWDPQRPKSTLADMTKWTRLLAYHYVQSTEPEEAVRHAVSDIFGKPLNGPRMQLWVPGTYNVAMVEGVANAVMRQAVGEEPDESPQAELPSMPSDDSAGQSINAENDDRSEGVVIHIIGGSQNEARGLPGVMPVANLLTKGEARIIANPGSKALGSTGGHNPQAEHLPLHFHIDLGDGRKVRVLSQTFEFYPGDEKVATVKHRDILKNLTEAERWYLKRATREVFYERRPTQKTIEGFAQRRLGFKPKSGGET